MKIKTCAIIPAAGKGVRFDPAQKKLFIKIKGKSVLWHTLQKFNSADSIDMILLPLDPANFNEQQKIIHKWSFSKPLYTIKGGKERQDSIYNALKFLKEKKIEPDIVVVHDGARPYVTPDLINSCIEEAKVSKAVITAIPVTDTVKLSDERNNVIQTIPRDNLWLVQTPQAYEYELLMNAYGQAYKDGFYGTDDAMLVERLNINVHILKGERNNIKITTKEDLEL